MHAEADILRQLVDIPQRQPEDVVPDAVLLERPQVILHDRHPAPDAIRRGPASAHRHEVLLDVLRLDPLDVDQPQQLLEVRRHLE